MRNIKSKILGIIPARGGSKGIPRKNIKKLCGKPLISYVFNAAIKCDLITELILTTDDFEIAEIGKSLGMEVPFIRPKELSNDTAKSIDVVKHAILEMERIKKTEFEYIILLQPTCPFTTTKQIEETIELIQKKELDTVSTVTNVAHSHPSFMYIQENSEFKKLINENKDYSSRHQLPKVFVRCGNIYVAKKEFVFSNGKLLGGKKDFLEIDTKHAVNIDEPIDWVIAEAICPILNEGISGL